MTIIFIISLLAAVFVFFIARILEDARSTAYFIGVFLMSFTLLFIFNYTNSEKTEIQVYDNTVVPEKYGKFLVTYQEGDTLKTCLVDEIKLIDEDKYYLQFNYWKYILYAPDKSGSLDVTDETLSIEDN